MKNEFCGVVFAVVSFQCELKYADRVRHTQFKKKLRWIENKNEMENKQVKLPGISIQYIRKLLAKLMAGQKARSHFIY